jgi:hypothetical protein
MQERLELASVQMTPASRLGLIPANQFTAANMTRPTRPGAMFDADIYLPNSRVQFGSFNKPRFGQA